MANVYRLILGMLLALCCSQSWASVPKTTQYSAWGTTLFPSAGEACQYWASTVYPPPRSASVSVEGGQCKAVVSMPGYPDSTAYRQLITQVSCPANSTSVDASSCTCSTGFIEQNGQCVAPQKSCKFGNTASAGYFDGGTSNTGGPAIMTCLGGCETVFDGSFPEGNALVGGVKHYYAQGEYIETGRECDGSATEVGQGIPLPQIPSDTCGPGEVMGKVNEKNVCTKGADSGAPATKPEPPTSKETEETTTVKDKDPAGNDRETTTTVKKNADGSTSTTTTVKVTTGGGAGGGGTTTTTTTTTTTGGKGGSNSNGDKDDGKETEKGKCEKNSSDEGCGGAAADVNGKTFYTAKEKTFSSVLTKASTDLRSSGIGSAMTGFWNVSEGGSCPVASWHIPYINADFAFDFMCQSFALNAMLVIKSVLLVVASFMAFRIAFE